MLQSYCKVSKIAIFPRNRVGHDSQMIALKLGISWPIRGAKNSCSSHFQVCKKSSTFGTRGHVIITEPHSDAFSKSAISVLKMQIFPTKIRSNSKSKCKRTLISLQSGKIQSLDVRTALNLLKVLTFFQQKLVLIQYVLNLQCAKKLNCAEYNAIICVGRNCMSLLKIRIFFSAT